MNANIEVIDTNTWKVSSVVYKPKENEVIYNEKRYVNSIYKTIFKIVIWFDIITIILKLL